jgi:hypothetical protein
MASAASQLAPLGKMETACHSLRTWDADAAVAGLLDTCGLIAKQALL